MNLRSTTAMSACATLLAALLAATAQAARASDTVVYSSDLTIHPSLPVMSVRLMGRYTTDETEPDPSFLARRMEVWLPDARRPLQTIATKGIFPQELIQYQLTADDFDFDGYNDIKLTWNYGASNFDAWVWLYRPAGRRFDHAPQVSGSNWMPDPIRQAAFQWYRSYDTGVVVAVYHRWQRPGRLVPVERHTQNYPGDPDVSLIELRAGNRWTRRAEAFGAEPGRYFGLHGSGAAVVVFASKPLPGPVSGRLEPVPPAAAVPFEGRLTDDGKISLWPAGSTGDGPWLFEGRASTGDSFNLSGVWHVAGGLGAELSAGPYAHGLAYQPTGAVQVEIDGRRLHFQAVTGTLDTWRDGCGIVVGFSVLDGKGRTVFSHGLDDDGEPLFPRQPEPDGSSVQWWHPVVGSPDPSCQDWVWDAVPEVVGSCDREVLAVRLRREPYDDFVLAYATGPSGRLAGGQAIDREPVTPGDRSLPRVTETAIVPAGSDECSRMAKGFATVDLALSGRLPAVARIPLAIDRSEEPVLIRRPGVAVWSEEGAVDGSVHLAVRLGSDGEWHVAGEPGCLGRADRPGGEEFCGLLPAGTPLWPLTVAFPAGPETIDDPDGVATLVRLFEEFGREWLALPIEVEADGQRFWLTLGVREWRSLLGIE